MLVYIDFIIALCDIMQVSSMLVTFNLFKEHLKFPCHLLPLCRLINLTRSMTCTIQVHHISFCKIL